MTPEDVLAELSTEQSCDALAAANGQHEVLDPTRYNKWPRPQSRDMTSSSLRSPWVTSAAVRCVRLRGWELRMHWARASARSRTSLRFARPTSPRFIGCCGHWPASVSL